MNMEDTGLYQAYLLRLWRSDPTQPWRATLLPVGTEGEKAPQHFNDGKSLLRFLRARMEPDPEPKDVE